MARFLTRLLSLSQTNRCLLSRPTTKATKQFVINKRWAHNFPVTYDFARERIMLVLRLYDKIDPEKLTLESHFYKDLGLDSLDHMEIIMEMEDEFNFEIPDRDLDGLLRPSDILRYITDHEEAYEELQKLQAESHHHHGHDEAHHGQESLAPDQSEDIKPRHGAITSDPQFGNLTANINKRGFCTSSLCYEVIRVPTTFGVDKAKPVSFDDIKSRVLKVCSDYDKIDSSKLQETSHFVDELGLDSLDHVEIVMEMEEEFGMEIPDEDAEKLFRPVEIARYIFEKETERRRPKPDERKI